MNVLFCLWLWYRATVVRDQVEIMAHEAFLPFSKRSWRQNAAAAVHRLMTMLLMRTTRRVWVSIPAWERYLRPYALRRRISYRWLPVPSTVPVTFSADDVAVIRAAVAPNREYVVGNVCGTYARHVSSMLAQVAPVVLNDDRAVLLIIGDGGSAWRDAFLSKHPHLSGRIVAPGRLTGHTLSCHIAACDVLVQPYPDGVTTRRTTAMAALAHGKAVVTNSGSLTEPFWAESGLVSLVRDEDARAMARAVLRLLCGADERAALGRAAAEGYRRRFETAHIVAALREAAADDAR
jgi:glycosyltransferase involved in cell wall biosynthesis